MKYMEMIAEMKTGAFQEIPLQDFSREKIWYMRLAFCHLPHMLRRFCSVFRELHDTAEETTRMKSFHL